MAAYGFRLSYDPEKVKPLASAQGVSEGDIFKMNPNGSLDEDLNWLDVHNVVTSVRETVGV